MLQRNMDWAGALLVRETPKLQKRHVDCKDSSVLCSSPISLNPSTENQGEFSQLKPSPMVESGAVMYQWHAVSGTSTAHLLQSSCHWGTWTHIRAANIKEKTALIIFGRAPQVFRDWSWQIELLRPVLVLRDAAWLVDPSLYFGYFPTSPRKHRLLSLRRRGNRLPRTSHSYSFTCFTFLNIHEGLLWLVGRGIKQSTSQVEPPMWSHQYCYPPKTGRFSLELASQGLLERIWSYKPSHDYHYFCNFRCSCWRDGNSLWWGDLAKTLTISGLATRTAI